MQLGVLWDVPHNLWQFPKFRKYHFMCCSLSYKNEHTIWTLFHTRMSTYCHTRIRTHSTNIYIVVHTEQNGDENCDILSFILSNHHHVSTLNIITDQHHLQLNPDDWDGAASVITITLSIQNCTLREAVICFSKTEMKNRSAVSMLRCWQ
jgi:hypothetical protein